MAEENQNVEPQEAPQEEVAPVFQLQRCYLKDASLEMPNAPGILLQEAEQEPEIDINFEVSQQPVSEGLYDVSVRGTITVKVGERTIILVEGKQSGLFVIMNLPEEALEHLQNVLCPSMVYPYLRANLADLMQRANVPPVHLPEVNFEMLYAQRLQEEAAKQGEPTASA